MPPIMPSLETGHGAARVIQLGELVMILGLHREGLSISAIACDLADDLHGSRRSVALALSRMADGVRLMVEGTLDHIEVRNLAAKS